MMLFPAVYVSKIKLDMLSDIWPFTWVTSSFLLLILQKIRNGSTEIYYILEFEALFPWLNTMFSDIIQ